MFVEKVPIVRKISLSTYTEDHFLQNEYSSIKKKKKKKYHTFYFSSKVTGMIPGTRDT